MRIPSAAWRICNALVDLLAPPLCAACDGSPTRLGLCASCGATLVAAREPAPRIHDVPILAPLAYEGCIVTAIQRLKYSDRPDLARPLGALLALSIRRSGLGPFDYVVPVPLHAKRLAERGYNQSALLARQIARAESCRCAPRLLRRTRDTPKQARVAGADRRRNVAGAFAVAAPGAVGRHRIMLVDDVVTTGATAAQCVEVLEARGACVVAVAAVAQAGSAGWRAGTHGRG